MYRVPFYHYNFHLETIIITKLEFQDDVVFRPENIGLKRLLKAS